MSAGVTYLVDIELAVKGNPAAELGGVESKVASLSSRVGDVRKAFGSIGSELVGGFTGAVEYVGGKLETLAKVGAAAVMGGVAYGVMGLNNELETTKISLGAVLNANNMTNGLEAGMERASGWIVQMRKDAKDLPGEFKDLLGFVQTAAGPAFSNGLDVDKFEHVSAQAMAAAKSLQVPMDQAAREYAQLMEGRAGAHNVFGTRLGIHASGFNEKTGEERVKILEAALGKFEPAIAAFGKTFDAQSSSLVDAGKGFLQAATSGLFAKITSSMGEANKWIDDNRVAIDQYAGRVGYQLEKAFDAGKAVILEYGPLLWDFAERAYDKVVRVWQDIEPYVKEIGAELKAFLKDDGSFDKIKTVLELYIAAKAGGKALSIGSSLWSAGSAVAGLFGGGGAAAGATGAATASVEGAAGIAAIEAGVTGFAAAGTTLSATLLAVPLAIGAAIGATIYEIRDANGRALGENAMGGGAYGYDEKELAAREKLIAGGIEAWKTLHNVGDIDVDRVGVGFDDVGDAANTLAFTLRSLAKSGDFEAANRINRAIETAELEKEAAARREATNAMAQDALKPLSAMAKDDTGATIYDKDGAMSAISIMVQKNLDAAAADKKALDEAKRKEAAKGKGGMNISKVEITVSGNGQPDQIARLVLSELQNVKRYRTSSPRTSNYSAGR